MTDEGFASLLKRVAGGEKLSSSDSARAFGAIMEGSVGEVPIAAFLAALAVRGPTVDEIVGAAQTMRARMTKVDCIDGAIDLCGTGGDGLGTLNISTAATFVVAGAGVPVAKHGNRNMSSKSGAADVIEALGARIDLAPEESTACLKATGVCFLFAQSHHAAMKHVAAVRRALGFRTIFNLLGPLSSPACVRRQLVGVYARECVVPVAEALARLGTDRAWVVHGSDGLDEITTTATTDIAILENGKVLERSIAPEAFGIPRSSLADIKGGTAVQNANAIRQLLAGEHGPYRDIVLLNSAAALCVAGKVDDIKQGLAVAAETIDTGRAKSVLERFVSHCRLQP